MSENEILPIAENNKDLMNERRATIAKLVESSDIKGLNRFGIVVIEEDKPTNETCYETAFSPTLYPKDILQTVLTKWKQVGEPEPGDAAFYFDRRGRLTHVGRAVQGGYVRSRWGQGGLLCEHSPLDIPLFAGLDIKVEWFREPR